MYKIDHSIYRIMRAIQCQCSYTFTLATLKYRFLEKYFNFFYRVNIYQMRPYRMITYFRLYQIESIYIDLKKRQ